MDHFKINSALGGELEFTDQPPPDFAYEKIPDSNSFCAHGPWGTMIFQQIIGLNVSAWYSQYFLNCPIEFTGSADIPVTELHNSIENYFTNQWDGIGLPTEKTGQGGFSHSPFVNNKAFFPKADLYRTFDFHFEKYSLAPYADAYPKLYEMLNLGERKKASQIDTLLQLDPDLKVIINQIKRLECTPSVRARYFLIKSEEFLIGALERMHPAQLKRAFSMTPAIYEKAEQLEFILRVRFADPLTLVELSRLVTTNVQSMGAGFKERYGMTVFQYVKFLRLEHAKKLLINSPNLGLEAIAIETNLYDAPRLAKAFKAFYGVTPGEFRKSGKTSK